MRTLVTGNDGYLGSCLVPELHDRGHETIGVDVGLFAGCGTGATARGPDVQIRSDIRDLGPESVEGVDGMIHLAGISNDPHGDLDPRVTAAVNAVATARLATMAKEAGVTRFCLASSCSVYGAAVDAWLDEMSASGPVTAYARAKLDAEQAVMALADDSFVVTALRCATAYGPSPRLRGDLVVNNLIGYAVATGEVLLKSSGSSWRPIVHVRDLARAFATVIEAPAELVSAEVFNVGSTAANFRVRRLAEMVAELCPDATLTVHGDAAADARSYRVNCDKLASCLPAAAPRISVTAGIVETIESLHHLGIDVEMLEGPRFQRLARVRELQEAGRLDEDLRWRVP